VFVYFSDHGAPGLIAFPNDYLYADQLLKTLNYMHQQKMYRQLVIYIEACESGSMFEGLLPSNISVYATTASTKDQSSYACYWDASRNAYLGDEFSVRWLEDSDAHDGSDDKWTLLDQFKVVKNQTLQSQPQQYGDLSVDTEAIDDFQGYNKFPGADPDQHHSAPVSTESVALGFEPCGSAVSSRDVKLHTLVNRRNALRMQSELDDGDVEESLEALESAVATELAERAWWDAVFDAAVVDIVGAPRADVVKTVRAPPRSFECLREAMASVEENCGNFNDYSLKWVYTLVNLCEKNVPLSTISNAFSRACSIL
jgi:legumain